MVGRFKTFIVAYQKVVQLWHPFSSGLVRLSQRREDESIGRTYRPIRKYGLDITFRVVHPYSHDIVTTVAARCSISIRGYAMKRATTPIPFAGSQLNETRYVCAFFNSYDEEFEPRAHIVNRLVPHWNPSFMKGSTDIQDRKRAEATLRARESELSQIINTIPELA
jgi:hypothetical protein